MIIAEANRPTILIVDDDPVSREILAQLLAIARFAALSAATGEHALALLEERGARIDWLFTAVQLPGLIDGWMVADQYRLHHPLRAIVYASCSDADLARSAAPDIIIRKPVSPIQAFSLIKRLTDDSRPATAVGAELLGASTRTFSP